MSRVVVIAAINVDPGDAPAMVALALTMAAATRAEPGCLHYAFAQDIELPGWFRLAEVWRDAAALDTHFATDHMAAFRTGVRALRLEHSSANAYDVHGERDLLAEVADKQRSHDRAIR